MIDRRHLLALLLGLAGLGAAPTRTRAAEADPGYWQCTNSECGHVYDPEMGEPTQNIPPGVRFEDLPKDWTCPVCGAAKDTYIKLKMM